MKKLVVILMVVITLGMIGEGLYNALAEFDTNMEAANWYTPVDAYPCELPDLTIDPCTDWAMF